MNITVLILFSIGVVFFIVSVFLKRKTKRFKTEGFKTVAQIISYVEVEQHDEDAFSTSTYYPLIKFVPNDGVKEVFKQMKIKTRPKPKTELPVNVSIYYIKEDSGYKILMDSKYWMYTVPKIVELFGLFFVVSGVVLGILIRFNLCC